MGPMEKVNRRTLNHLSSLSTDLSDLGAKFNAFALSEPSPSLAAAIERVGQAADSSYIATEELSSSLGASFAEPMRESAQFAGVVRSVLRYRILKRVQQEMANDELIKKKALLEQLETSEAEAKRIDQYLSSSQQIGGSHQVHPPRRSSSMKETSTQHYRESSGEDTASIDSDFPHNHGDVSSAPSARVGAPERSAPGPNHKKVPSGNSITNKIFGPIRHAIQGVADVDPERTRRDAIGKTRESIEQLEQAQVAAAQDVKDASASILQDLKRFQHEKEDDLRRYMVSLLLCLPSSFVFQLTVVISLPTLRARLSGRGRTRRLGKRQRRKSRRSTRRRTAVMTWLTTAFLLFNTANGLSHPDWIVDKTNRSERLRGEARAGLVGLHGIGVWRLGASCL